MYSINIYFKTVPSSSFLPFLLSPSLCSPPQSTLPPFLFWKRQASQGYQQNTAYHAARRWAVQAMYPPLQDSSTQRIDLGLFALLAQFILLNKSPVLWGPRLLSTAFKALAGVFNLPDPPSSGQALPNVRVPCRREVSCQIHQVLIFSCMSVFRDEISWEWTLRSAFKALWSLSQEVSSFGLGEGWCAHSMKISFGP